MDRLIGVIAGTGFAELAGLEVQASQEVTTPYGQPSAKVQTLTAQTFSASSSADQTTESVPAIAFLPRHGNPHRIPPHAVNYRANIWALHSLGCKQVITINAVGGIHADTAPGRLIIPHDIIDYTYGRTSSYWHTADDAMQHVDMCQPYAANQRGRLLSAADSSGIDVVPTGVMAVTQGPRLETPAEIRRLENDGATIVGMTGMPEAALAKELGMELASLAFSVNWAAGKGSGKGNGKGGDEGDGSAESGQQDIHAEIEQHIATGTAAAQAILLAYLQQSCSNLVTAHS